MPAPTVLGMQVHHIALYFFPGNREHGVRRPSTDVLTPATRHTPANCTQAIDMFAPKPHVLTRVIQFLNTISILCGTGAPSPLREGCRASRRRTISQRASVFILYDILVPERRIRGLGPSLQTEPRIRGSGSLVSAVRGWDSPDLSDRAFPSEPRSRGMTRGGHRACPLTARLTRPRTYPAVPDL